MNEQCVTQFTTAAEVDEAVRKAGRLAYVDVPAPAYHATQAVSQSTLKKVAASPAKLKWEREHPRYDTPAAFKIGTAVHLALLEPDKFDTSYTSMPKVDRRTKEGKAKAEEHERAANGRIVLTEDEMDIVQRIYARSRADKELGVYFEGGSHELSFFAQDEQTGLVLRCRPDQLVTVNGLQVVVDLKTTDCATESVFEKDILNYGYLTQAAFYMDTLEAATGRRPDAFVIVAVEKSRDCDYTTWMFDDDTLAFATEEYRRWLSVYADCVKTGVWPGYKRGLISYKLPKWKVNKFEEAW